MSDRWFTCPDCGMLGVIDDDQYHGRVSIDCPECPYHKTINLAEDGEGSA